MPSFRNANSKARHAIRDKVAHGTARHGNKNDGKIHSLGTERNYSQALKGVQYWLNETRQGDLKGMSSDLALSYLRERATIVAQKTLDLDRQALQMLVGEKLERVKASAQSGRLGSTSRAYTPEQVKAVVERQSERYALSTEIAYAAGLRAHELLTIRPSSERAASSHREWSSNRFEGREGCLFTIVGKGGLIVEKLLPNDLADRLEARRLETPEKVRDRGINYERLYDIAGGKKWSEDFSRTSKQIFSYSTGGHGLRHGYVQEREVELQGRGYTLNEARGIVSQECGHFDPDTVRKGYER